MYDEENRNIDQEQEQSSNSAQAETAAEGSRQSSQPADENRQTGSYGYQGQSGTGYQNQSGYGYQSQSGSGYQDQSGYGYQSQSGSGYQGQTGSGNQSQSGTGYQSQTGSGQQGYYSQMNGQTYQPYQTPQQTPKKKDRKPGRFKKAAGLVAAALVFGFVAGGTMVGVNMLADSMQEETTPAPSVSQQQEQVSLSDEELDKIVGRLNLDADKTGATAMDVSGIVENAMPSVVAINNTMLYQSVNPWFGRTQTYEVPSAGSGIIVGQNDTELLIATNNHVVEDANELSVVFIDDTELESSVKGTDSESDLAIVAVPLDSIPAETMNKISIAQLGDSEELKIGQGVIAIGNALGYGQAVTVGYVSALNREVKTDGNSKHLIQTDAAINPGNSGGALLNMQGEVIGINEAKYSDTDVEGMGFAIPISQAQEILDSLMVRRSGETVKEDEAGYLGIQGVTAGVYVYRIVEGGAAEKTDLHEKDVITKFDGQMVKTMASLQSLLQYYKKGETVEMVVQSLVDGEYVERTITITLGGQVSAD